jgi:hypothetical protein
MNLTGQTVAQKPKRAKPNPAYLAKVRELPCIICTSFGLPQNSPTQAHHVIHQRGSFRKVPDEMSDPPVRRATTRADGYQQGCRASPAVTMEAPVWP